LSDARERLRLYLEQRREMGESELVLDSLSVDDALRLLGATPSQADDRATGTRDATRSEASSEERAEPPSTAEAASPAIEGGSVDWRAALRATGASPDEMAKKKTGRFDFPTPDTSAGVASNADASAAAAPPSESRSNPIEPAFESPFDDVQAGLSVGAPGGELFGGSMATLATLADVAAHIASCTRCPLHATATNPVPGEGNPDADFMCVGEAPGQTEDETGRPFIGAAGQLLTKILEAIQLPRDQVFICNVLKHRPPGNRNPLPDEVKACSPYLIRQIELVRPKVILALGTFAAQTLLNTTLSLGKLRSQIHRYYGVPLIVTYHPAALLRNPSWKRPTWEDVQLARRILDRANAGA
jgi:DNA polymerase